MGLFGGKSRSSTSSQQTTTNVQDIDTTTIGLEDSAGAIAGGRDVSVTQISTDQGSVEAGRKVAAASLDFAGEFGTASVKRAFDFGSDALGTVQTGLSDVLDFGGDITKRALDVTAKQSAETTKTLSGAIERAAAATRSDTSEGLQKIVMVVAIAGVLGVIAFAFIRRR